MMKNLMSGPQFIQFLEFVVYMALSIRFVEQSLQNVSFDFVVSVLNVVFEFVLIYSSCHFSTNITIKLTNTANIIYNTRWYDLPLRQQKMIVAIIRQGQIPNELSGYIFSISLETFMKVTIAF